MNFTDYMWIKLIVLALLAFFANFFFTLITGKTIEEALNERRNREGRD